MGMGWQWVAPCHLNGNAIYRGLAWAPLAGASFLYIGAPAGQGSYASQERGIKCQIETALCVLRVLAVRLLLVRDALPGERCPGWCSPGSWPHRGRPRRIALSTQFCLLLVRGRAPPVPAARPSSAARGGLQQQPPHAATTTRFDASRFFPQEAHQICFRLPNW
jgi:hypothetical protein